MSEPAARRRIGVLAKLRATAARLLIISLVLARLAKEETVQSLADLLARNEVVLVDSSC